MKEINEPSTHAVFKCRTCEKLTVWNNRFKLSTLQTITVACKFCNGRTKFIREYTKQVGEK